MTTPVIQSSRLLLDPITRADADAVLEYCSDEELQHWVPVPAPYSRADAEFFTTQYATDAATSPTFSLWAIRLIDEPALGLPPELRPHNPLVGAIELRFEPVKSGTIGFWLGKPHRGRGIMTEAVQTLVEFALDEQGFDLTRIHWQARVGNWASATVARRNGFQFEGVSRGALVHGSYRVDSWEATLLRDDPRELTEGWPL